MANRSDLMLTCSCRRFSGDEAFLTDPNAFNDAANEPLISKDSRILEGRGYRL